MMMMMMKNKEKKKSSNNNSNNNDYNYSCNCNYYNYQWFCEWSPSSSAIRVQSVSRKAKKKAKKEKKHFGMEPVSFFFWERSTQFTGAAKHSHMLNWNTQRKSDRFRTGFLVRQEVEEGAKKAEKRERERAAWTFFNKSLLQSKLLFFVIIFEKRDDGTVFDTSDTSRKLWRLTSDFFEVMRSPPSIIGESRFIDPYRCHWVICGFCVP